MRTSRSVIGMTALLVLVAGCADPARPSVGALALGTWGGANAGVVVTETQTHVHVGCTLGDIPARVVADAEGRFEADGSYQLRAFPIAVEPAVPARFSGRVVGRILTLAIVVEDTIRGTTEHLGPVTVRLGDAPQLGPCPICAVPGIRSRLESRRAVGRDGRSVTPR